MATAGTSESLAATLSREDRDALLAWFRANERGMEMESALVWDPLAPETLAKELDLTPAQRERVGELRHRFEIEEALWRSHSLLESDVDRKLFDLRNRYRALIRRELSPEQQQRYDCLDSHSWDRIRTRSPRSRDGSCEGSSPGERVPGDSGD